MDVLAWLFIPGKVSYMLMSVWISVDGLTVKVGEAYLRVGR